MALSLRPWGDDDRAVLTKSNLPQMMTDLGGPETPEKLDQRHERYLRMNREGTAAMFVIVTDDHPEGVGAIGYWNTDDGDLEAGWNVHLEHQGHGYAAEAVRLLLQHAAIHTDRDVVRAIPGEANAASNAVCRKAGFTYVRTFDGEYPPGVPRRENEWVFELGEVR